METASDKKSLLRKKPRLLFAIDNTPKIGWLKAAHCHDYCEISLIREGTGKIEANGQITQVAAGDVFICNPGVYHCEFMDNAENRKITFLGVRLKLDDFPENCLLKSDYKIIRNAQCFNQLSLCADGLVSETENKQTHYGFICENLLNIFVAIIMRFTSPDYEKLLDRKKTYLEVKKYLDANFTKIMSVEKVCEELYINKFYLSHLFKDAMGLPPLKYITIKKIEAAKQLLLITDDSIKEIAISCGFSDPAYFCRVFKKIAKLSPSQFRGTTKKDI